MHLDLAFLVFAVAAVASPGPGVLMTLTNALRGGWRGALGGIVGLALGAAAVAGLSATGLGLLLATSPRLFAVARWVGAAYLVWLGVRLWLAPPPDLAAADAPASFRDRVVTAFSLQLTNPKALAFFLAVFPQFLDRGARWAPQFASLVLTYAAVILAVHSIYALAAGRVRAWIVGSGGGVLLHRLGGACFCAFGVALALAPG